MPSELEEAMLAEPTPEQESPKAKNKKRTPTVDEEDIFSLITSLRNEVRELREGKNSSPVLNVRNRVKTHTAQMREFYLPVETDEPGVDAGVEDEPKGLVVKLHSMKEVKDPTEAKRYYGVCKADVLDPHTGKITTYKGVNYIDFLERPPIPIV